MPLRNTLNIISPSELYPDAISVRLQYAVSFRTTRDELSLLLHDYGFRRTRGIRGLAIRLPVLGQEIHVALSRANPFSPISVSLRLNSLKKLHAESSRPQVEAAYDNSTNWLHHLEPNPGLRLVCQSASEMLQAANLRVLDILRSLSQSLGGDLHPPQLLRAKIDEAEVAVDFVPPDLEASFDALSTAITRNFDHALSLKYGSTASSYAGSSSKTTFVHAYRRAGERYKVYLKTNRRIRLESHLTNQALKNAGLRRHVLNLDLYETYLPIAQYVADHFNYILDEATATDLSYASPIEFLSAVGMRFRSREAFQNVVSTLVRSGHLHTSINRAAVEKLVEDGILTRGSVRGIRPLARRYHMARETLREAQRDFFNESEREHRQ
ncbi:hypothetical protein [Ferrovibrio sp.]|uniref:hypothetical protein n=1 Tax=Ferrovibrio sp. TaxID=1917215 RepID=UPI001B3D21C3|nr:hypothetical protein [Ferrovibrio sp.]MBP7065503.1 hypothetical protein [Ferrovibrio sp.]